jgi:hypothetical protein
MRQRDKSKIPPLISTYKYFLPQYSSSTLPFSIFNPISSGEDLDEKLQNSSNEKLPCSKTLNPVSSSPQSPLHLGRNAHQIHRTRG